MLTSLDTKSFLSKLINRGGDPSILIVPPNDLVMTTTVNALNSTEEDIRLHCEHGALLGPLGLFVQGLLAFIAFGALISEYL